MQRVPAHEDFLQALPPPQTPIRNQAWTQPQSQSSSQGQIAIQQMIAQMALRMNTLELGISESCKQMHTLQEMLTKTHI